MLPCTNTGELDYFKHLNNRRNPPRHLYTLLTPAIRYFVLEPYNCAAGSARVAH